MRPLQTNKRVLTLLCLYPSDESVSKWKQLTLAVFTFLIIAANMCGLIASSFYFVKFVSTDLETSLHALLQMAALSAATYMLVIGLVLRQKINDIFSRLKNIYDASKNNFQENNGLYKSMFKFFNFLSFQLRYRQ